MRTVLLRIILAIAASAALVVTALAAPAGAKVPGPNGEILFGRFSPALGDTVLYTVNPDGTHLQQVLPHAVECPHWSPDGRLIATCGLPDGSSTVIINPDTRSSRELFPSDLSLHLACAVWSPDSARLACGQFDQATDPSQDGMYTIRSSDGGGLQQVTSNPGGGDEACDYSPDGAHIAFLRMTPDGSEALDTVNVDTGAVQQLAPAGTTLTDFECGSWSPRGNQILFAARAAAGQRFSIWEVNSDGTGLHQVPITPACGGAVTDPTSRSCHEPGWSPDGTKIVFDIFVPATGKRSIYTVNADGSGLFQVTHGSSAAPGEGDQFPDWGPHPTTP
jgi:Tol biopolymer transport system component